MPPAIDSPKLLWTPTDDFKSRSNLHRFQDWLRERDGLSFPDYQALWQWSVDQPELFWERVWAYFQVKSHTPYRKVLSTHDMPGARWFSGSTLNYAEHVFRMADASRPAIIFRSEKQGLQEISWASLGAQVGALAGWLREQGVGPGDRVVAYLPNIPEATVAFLAVCSLGAVWSACSPDFGLNSVVDRFQQINPVVLIAVDGYQYGGKPFDKRELVQDLYAKLPSLEKLVLIPYADASARLDQIPQVVYWQDIMARPEQQLTFTPVPFEHPIWVLFSSGTTGLPKAITHSHGGVLLEHLKYLAFHNDVHPGERFFWFSTTGWMMWNFVQAALLVGATIVLYDGSPAYPSLNVLWEFSAEAGIHHFGTSAPFLVACMKEGIQPGRQFDLSALRSIGSTGSPLPPEAFDYVYDAIKRDLWLCSMSGGTDVCTAFVGGCPTEPVYAGEIQCRGLACALYAFDEDGQAVADEVGEMVITKPMPSMPVFFWNDPGERRYLDSYFDLFPGIWRHGDWVKITPRNTLIIYGRSDATLNRQGIRIGTAEIYRSVDKIPDILDSLIVNLELEAGRHFMPLFVVLAKDIVLTEELKQRVNRQLREDYSPRHVPDAIIAVPEIPYTISGKKMEAPVKKILLGFELEKVASKDSMRNPGALEYFFENRGNIIR